MRRILYTLIAGAAIAAVIPASALAQGHDRGHRRDNERQHRHHARVHHRHFGRIDAPAMQNAGTVSSFDGRTLAIRLNDGSTVTGVVNGDTEIRCVAFDRDHRFFENDDHGGGSGSSGGPGASGSGTSGGPSNGDAGGSGSATPSGGDDNGDRGDDNGNHDRNDDNDMRNCGRLDLRPGTVVHEADLRLSPLGAIWQEVELVVRFPQGQDH